jgi:GTP-binding protein
VLVDLRERWARRAPTAVVNEIVRAAQEQRSAPGGIRYRYVTQVSSGPPTFVAFGARAPDDPYRRFLEGRLRAELGLEGVPIRFRFRAGRRARPPGGSA